MLNQGWKTYATVIFGYPSLSQVERSSRKLFALILQATDNSLVAGLAAKEAFTHMGELTIDLIESGGYLS